MDKLKEVLAVMFGIVLLAIIFMLPYWFVCVITWELHSINPADWNGWSRFGLLIWLIVAANAAANSR